MNDATAEFIRRWNAMPLEERRLLRRIARLRRQYWMRKRAKELFGVRAWAESHLTQSRS